MAATSTCRSMGRGRAAGGRARGPQLENNFGGQEPLVHGSVVYPTPGGVPPSPQPLTHPATDPGPSGAGVFFFVGGPRISSGNRLLARLANFSENRREPWNQVPLLAIAAFGAITHWWAGVSAGLADPSLGTKPGAYYFAKLRIRPSPPPGRRGAPSRCDRKSRGSRG